ncbi:hypothetical protein LC605_28040 [Nostoc sp. CHAB 5836]|uniref:NACHT domain-containing protein n=1 Tax=Nostoc sp. CHAB 5836 TaxID=2780404 RepID=UPI001E2E5BA9|nr:hypothetical protein [Nostoc sp. CHAB 5836]MCC5618866.1 hypothetical protein [Nostoc sp. CHAB 5836]
MAQINQIDEAISHHKIYQYRNRKTLLNKVRNYWVDGVLKTSLQGRVPIEMGMEEAFDLVETASRMISELLHYQDRPTLPPGTKVINKLDQMGEGATLLIVGEPGGGKTITLLELACDLITRAERDINQPIPVVLDISFWEKKKQKFEDWIVQELTTNYQISESLSKDWLKEQQLLLLLDNLDELSPKSRELCIQALNQFSKKYGQTQIVVCSCIRDYQVLSNRLKFQDAIYLRPLKYEQVYHYLVSSGSELATVNTVLQEDTALQELVKTPLMLSIIIHAFWGMSVKELSEIYSITERRRHIFNTYVEQAFYHRSARQPYSKELVIKWLTWLAKRMSQKSQNIFLIEHLQPSWLQTSIQKWMYHLGVGLINGVIGGAIGGLIGGLIGQRITVVIGGVITGLIAGFIGAVTEKIEPVETLKWSQRKAVIGLKNGMVIGFSVGLFVSLFGDIIGVFISVGLSTLLFFGLLGGTTGLVTNGLSGPQIDIEKRKFPNQGIWQSLVNAVILALISMLLSGLISEISGQALGLVAGLIGGMISGSIVSIASIQHFLLRLILWQNGSIPWNYSRFLNSATKRMFLQKKSGGSYIFIYHLLQEHFASL